MEVVLFHGKEAPNDIFFEVTMIEGSSMFAK
jgi:hypothetical protein